MQQFHWGTHLVRLCRCLCHHQLSSLQPAIPCVYGINSCCVSSPHASITTLCIFYGETSTYNVYTSWHGAYLYSSVYTSTCKFTERAMLRFFTDHFITNVYISVWLINHHQWGRGALLLAQNAWHCTSFK